MLLCTDIRYQKKLKVGIYQDMFYSYFIQEHKGLNEIQLVCGVSFFMKTSVYVVLQEERYVHLVETLAKVIILISIGGDVPLCCLLRRYLVSVEIKVFTILVKI
jgi:hypothetical protein